jgi:hypothetical protein
MIRSGAPRVRCQQCEFAWYGRATAHGLAVLGHCPRCGGELIFSEPGPPAAPPERESEDLGAEPSRVLGLPTSRS